MIREVRNPSPFRVIRESSLGRRALLQAHSTNLISESSRSKVSVRDTRKGLSVRSSVNCIASPLEEGVKCEPRPCREDRRRRYLALRRVKEKRDHAANVLTAVIHGHDWRLMLQDLVQVVKVLQAGMRGWEHRRRSKRDEERTLALAVKTPTVQRHESPTRGKMEMMQTRQVKKEEDKLLVNAKQPLLVAPGRGSRDALNNLQNATKVLQRTIHGISGITAAGQACRSRDEARAAGNAPNPNPDENPTQHVKQGRSSQDIVRQLQKATEALQGTMRGHDTTKVKSWGVPDAADVATAEAAEVASPSAQPSAHP